MGGKSFKIHECQPIYLLGAKWVKRNIGGVNFGKISVFLKLCLCKVNIYYCIYYSMVN